MIKAFYEDIDFMKKILSSIKNQEIQDADDNLKEAILRKLYPKHINHTEVAEYLLLYTRDVVGCCNYLFETEYINKFALIDQMHKLSFSENRKPKLLLPKNAKYFIKDYLLETILMFEEGLTSKDIYEIIKHFKQYYASYEMLKPESYRYSITDKLEKKTSKLNKLANELFSYYVDDFLRGEMKGLYLFNYFFNYKSPTEQKNILLSKMNANLDQAINRILFCDALRYCNEADLEELNSIVKKYKFEQILYDWQHPKKSEWEIEDEERTKKREEEIRLKKGRNEADISALSDKQIRENIGILHFITKHLYFESNNRRHRYLEDKTVERLERILKEVIYNRLISPELLTIELLAENSPHANRYIDRVYYVSSCLNGNDLSLEKLDEKFIKYLYIVNLSNINVGNVLKGKLVEKLELSNPELVKATLQKFIRLLFKKYFIKQEKVLLEYVDDEDDVEQLKAIMNCYGNNDEEILNSIFRNFLKVFNFNIQSEHLNEMRGDSRLNDENCTMLQALSVISEGSRNSFSMPMAVSIYSLFEHDSKKLKKFSPDIKLMIVDYMMDVFSTEELIKFQSGFQSSAACCASFLSREALYLFESLEELNALLKSHSNENDIWNKRILHRICEIKQVIADNEKALLTNQELKDFIFRWSIISAEDFFEEIYYRIENIRSEIEDNRDNAKNAFYNEDGNSKNENNCRDVIFNKLKDKFEKELCLTREKYEADKRADINIKYKSNHKYEIQVE